MGGAGCRIAECPAVSAVRNLAGWQIGVGAIADIGGTGKPVDAECPAVSAVRNLASWQ